MIKPQNLLTKVLLISVLILLTFNVSFGQSIVEKLDKLYSLYHEYEKFNGTILVAHKGEVIFEKGYGMANFEWDIPNMPSTKHRLGSITKQFTAVAILQLVAEGKLSLYEPISKYLPDYPKPNADKINLHHLLTHTSGIPNYTSFPGFFEEKSRDPYGPVEFLKFFADSTLNFIPGEKFEYSNSGYFLLGVVIEKATGKSYEEVLKEKIFEPLQMNGTGYDHQGEIIKNRATGYERKGSKYKNSAYLDMSIPYAAGSLYSTVQDLYTWDQALYTEKLLPKKYMNLMFEKHVAAFGMHYGYGWVVGKIPLGNSKDRMESIGHGGGINGFNTDISRIPSDNTIFIALNNTGGAPLHEMRKGTFGILYGKKYDLPKKSIAQTLFNVIVNEDIDAGLKRYDKIKKNKEYSLDEDEMNAVGYDLLAMKKNREAEEVFRLNVEAFPKSFNVYDSYGEVLMKQGKNDLAIKNYKKSVELNPGNQNGKNMLKKLGVNIKEIEKEVVVPIKVLDTYVGQYEIMPEFILSISREGKKMFAQATGQPSAEIFPSSESTFYLKVVAAKLRFNKNKNGRVEGLTLFQGGKEMTGKKLTVK